MHRYRKPVQRIDWAASAYAPRLLPLGLLRGVSLDMVLTTTNGIAAALTNYDLAKVIDRLTVKLSGQDDIYVMPGYHLNQMNYYDYTQACFSTIDTAAGAGKTQKICLWLPFALVRAAMAKDTLLDARNLDANKRVTSIELGIDFAAAAIGTDVTVTSGYINLNASLYDKVEAGFKTGRHEFSYIKADLSSVGEINVKLPYGGQNEYRRLFIYTFDNAGALSDTQVSQFQLQAGTYSWDKITHDQLKADNNNQFSLTPDTGVYVLDLVTDGRMTERLFASNLTDELLLTVTSAVTNGTIEIVAEKVIGAAF
uniref:Viral coat protein P2 C-terminal domain-containing protein n=2 Tax=viral metagenome TaxID=1070528 RepID=A0A6H1Z5T4_9ZZZZ